MNATVTTTGHDDSVVSKSLLPVGHTDGHADPSMVKAYYDYLGVEATVQSAILFLELQVRRFRYTDHEASVLMQAISATDDVIGRMRDIDKDMSHGTKQDHISRLEACADDLGVIKISTNKMIERARFLHVLSELPGGDVKLPWLR